MNVSIAENEGKSRAVRRRAGRTGCSVEATLSVIGGVWKPVLLFHLLGGKLRFNAICRLTPNATQRMITLQLRELEADGIVERTVFPEVPPRVEYALTPLGRTLKPVLLSMRSWGADFQAGLDGERPTTAATPCAEANVPT
ncbi:helix-turn-helix transcriptional regulator [Sphingopyxis sp. BSN-002]|uniref:winged helix-turn-helix transcriptional regulator n=1 Tax=Sphingopyxis sp. BSN-002 TaxID=2911495 RepID=UPI001EDB50B3|nr:helix-turn-helix domain-containing protein [Sphingopyxis sp. BSN-002]UKK84161.1 helix-turn-helix transcriptional regulator [Sphingopyxis sp. BSN-002]